MKSEHRHELETNALARHINKWIDSGMPYGQTAVWIVIGLLLAAAAWSWYGRISLAWQGAAWEDYNLAVERGQPNLDLLERAAEQNPGTPVAEISEITWADGKLFEASRNYLIVKSMANESLDAAAKKYEEILQTARDSLLTSRAHWGLGRVYEMRADIEKAKNEYEQVTGPFEPLAKQRLEELKRAGAQETLTWLASAEIPRRPFPTGGGIPGVRPEFQADEFGMPFEEAGPERSLDDILKGLLPLGTETPDRYAPPGDQPPPGVTEEAPSNGPELPMSEDPPAEENSAGGKP